MNCVIVPRRELKSFSTSNVRNNKNEIKDSLKRILTLSSSNSSLKSIPEDNVDNKPENIGRSIRGSTVAVQTNKTGNQDSKTSSISFKSDKEINSKNNNDEVFEESSKNDPTSVPAMNQYTKKNIIATVNVQTKRKCTNVFVNSRGVCSK